MARIRSIKPDFFQSEDVSALPLRARLTWIGLWTHCDDHGRTKDVPRLIKGWIWSMDDITLRDVEDDLEALGESGRIVRYRVNDRSYLAITNWHHHQSINRPGSANYPAPSVPAGVPGPGQPRHCPECWESDENARSGAVSAASVTTHGTLSEDSRQERKGKEGNREGKGSVGDAIADADDPRPELDALCAHLADRVEANGSPRPATGKKWRDAARLMLDRDGRTEQQIHSAIDWCQDHEFWRSNILSMPKLREKYDQLRLQAHRNGDPVNRRQAETDAMFDRAMTRAEAREAGQK